HIFIKENGERLEGVPSAVEGRLKGVLSNVEGRLEGVAP
ncbi:unnamed protein product, partial [marine sediment metagenome]